MTNTKSKQETLPPGLYFIGDLTYLTLSEKDNEQYLWGEDGVLTSESGEQFAKFSIGNDGVYWDNEGHEYDVDSASIGAYPFVSDLAPLLGRCVEFPEEFTVAYDEEHGHVRFGEIEIGLVDFDWREPLTRPEGMSDLDWLRERAKAEDSEAQYTLYEELESDPETHKEAIKWMFAAARGGHSIAQYDAGYMRKYAEDHQQHHRDAVKWLRLSAEQGFSMAQYELGDSYDNGLGVEQDSKEAVKWFRLSAEQGYSIAQDALGQCYYDGNGIEKSDKDAIYWWKQAAEEDHPYACLSLAKYYLGLEGSPRTEENLQRTFKWFLPSVMFYGADLFESELLVFVDAANEFLETRGDKNNPRSVPRLPDDADLAALVAFCYEHGLGVEKDVERAEKIRNCGLG